MFRFLIFFLDGLGTICVLLSPVAIVHWTLKAFKIEALNSLIQILDPLFTPLTQITARLLPLPPFQWNNESIDIAQGVLGVLLTAVFFITSFLSNLLKAMDYKLSYATGTWQENQKVRQKEQEAKRLVQVKAEEKKLLILLTYEANGAPAAEQLFQKFRPAGGQETLRYQEKTLFEFMQPEKGLDCCIDIARAVAAYNAALRPMDKPIIYRMALHTTAPDNQKTVAQDQNTCSVIIDFAGQNQMVFSEALKHYFEGKHLIRYRYRSMGFYRISSSREEEIFQLLGLSQMAR